MNPTQHSRGSDNAKQAFAADDPWRVLPAIIDSVRDEAPDVHTYTLSLRNRDDANAYSFQPGQFNMLYLPGVGEVAMSISGDPNQSDRIVHSIRTIGNVTGSLSRCEVGGSLGVRGPFGSHWPMDRCVGKEIIIVAGGIGLAPIRPVIYSIADRRDKFGTASLLIGSRSPNDMLYQSEFSTWIDAGISVQSTVDRADDRWSGNIGVVTLLLQRLTISDPANTVLLTCGPEVMMKYAIQTAMGRGVDASNIWLSLERNMNCAIGHCGHCQLGPHFICKDGPVLRYDQVSQLMEVDSL